MSAKSQLLFVIIVMLSGLCVASLALLVGEGPKNPHDFPDAVERIRFVETVNNMIQEQDAKADELVQEGKPMEAAIVKAELAAAYSILMHSVFDKESSIYKPTPRELGALWYFRIAGKREVYEDFLKLKYPTWESNDLE